MTNQKNHLSERTEKAIQVFESLVPGGTSATYLRRSWKNARSSFCPRASLKPP